MNEQISRLLTVSIRDLADLDDTEFKGVWDALGKIARIQGKRQKEEEEQKSEG